MNKYIATILATAGMLFALHASAQNINAQVNVNTNVGKNNVEVNATATANQDKNEDKSSTTKIKATNEVSTAARDIRGWDNEEKQDFLATVKTHAELKSGQDLDNFAKGVMLADEHVGRVTASEDDVQVTYKLPAKFLGVFSTQISAITNVTFESDKTGRGPKEVTVRFPWYKMFFSLDEDVRVEVLESAIQSSVDVNAQVPRDNHYAQNGRTIQLISNVLKAIRAEVEATTTATATVN